MYAAGSLSDWFGQTIVIFGHSQKESVNKNTNRIQQEYNKNTTRIQPEYIVPGGVTLTYRVNALPINDSASRAILPAVTLLAAEDEELLLLLLLLVVLVLFCIDSESSMAIMIWYSRLDGFLRRNQILSFR